MESNQPGAFTAPLPPSPQQPKTVNDVAPPPAQPIPTADKPVEFNDHAPADDPDDPASLPVNVPEPEPVKPPKTPRQPGNGTGLAIVASVIVVLGLGAMMLYAYLHS